MAMGHGPWVMWIMGQLCDGSHGSWATKDDPFPSLPLAGGYGAKPPEAESFLALGCSKEKANLLASWKFENSE